MTTGRTIGAHGIGFRAREYRWARVPRRAQQANIQQLLRQDPCIYNSPTGTRFSKRLAHPSTMMREHNQPLLRPKSYRGVDPLVARFNGTRREIRTYGLAERKNSASTIFIVTERVKHMQASAFMIFRCSPALDQLWTNHRGIFKTVGCHIKLIDTLNVPALTRVCYLSRAFERGGR